MEKKGAAFHLKWFQFYWHNLHVQHIFMTFEICIMIQIACLIKMNNE